MRRWWSAHYLHFRAFAFKAERQWQVVRQDSCCTVTVCMSRYVHFRRDREPACDWKYHRWGMLYKREMIPQFARIVTSRWFNAATIPLAPLPLRANETRKYKTDFWIDRMANRRRGWSEFANSTRDMIRHQYFEYRDLNTRRGSWFGGISMQTEQQF